MNIQEIIDNLKKGESEGLQIQKQNGILTSTWLIYKRKDGYYYFDINQKIEFTKNIVTLKANYLPALQILTIQLKKS